MILASNKVELLAPAGGRTQLEAAVRYGANAVYLAADRFGMRQRATNFALENIPEAVAFAHSAGVSVHVTLNTLMHADDIAQLPSYCEALAAAGVDAFIVSDLGAFSVARRHAPGVDIHVSTQASVSNAESARVWHELGAARVVCAREMSVEDIVRLRLDTPKTLEIEAFVHGAMCMAVSGRCLLSSAMAARSANKGHCTQSCRWSYALVEEQRPGEYLPIEEDERGAYVMSAQDLCMIEHLDELAAAGVTSFKIEGRNKKAFYVATAVHAYRQVLDGAPPASVMSDLLAVSHRPYSTGFYYGMAQQSLDHNGYERECLHVATVRSCEAVGEGRWKVRAVCFNRFAERDELELLTPSCPVQKICVTNLNWLPATNSAEYESVPVPVPVANRASEVYSFTSEVPADTGDFLRIRVSS